MALTFQGQTYTWRISDRPIGSGDAGEVYAATCVDQPNLIGMMKKPTKIATGGTIQRQAGQIAQESLALARLDGLPQGKAHPPRLLDQAHEYTRGTANYFIVSETAPGEDLASMLAQTRQSGNPFPRRVIITVLDALFDLFSRAHKAGVLWNDIKLEHIYWHNETAQVAVIDWGNALFLDKGKHGTPHAPPRWEDYHQMVDTLGDFLKRSAPDLYADLGWDQFQSKQLDAARISILARRIAYQQQVVALQVMEYQSLIRVIIKEEPTLTGLRRILAYQGILEEIGAPWEQEAVLAYAQSLVKICLARKDIQGGIKATALMWEHIGDSLDLAWHLLREYYRVPEILTHDELEMLVQHTLNADWSKALWVLIIIAHDVHNPSWWNRLAPVLRQKSLGSDTNPPPFQTCQSLLQWSLSQDSRTSNRSQALESLLQTWRRKGNNLVESPFDYVLLDLIQENPDIPQQIRVDIKKSFSAGEETIRDVLQVWSKEDWEALPKAFRQVACWDPDRWGIISLAESVAAFRVWMQKLYQGPASEANVTEFLKTLLKERPPVERLLGVPPWLTALINMLQKTLEGSPVSNDQSLVRKWCPWLLKNPNTHTPPAGATKADQSIVHQVLSGFTGNLKTRQDTSFSLERIHQFVPTYHSFCKTLADGFDLVFSPNADLNRLESQCQNLPHPSLAQSCLALEALINWRKQVTENDLAAAIEALNHPHLQEWEILDEALEITIVWQESILPTLQSLGGFSPLPERTSPDNKQKPLADLTNIYNDIQQLWDKIEIEGIHPQLLDSLVEMSDQAHAIFHEWRQSCQHSNNQAAGLLYVSFLELIHQIADRLFNLSQHSRLARLSWLMLEKGGQALSAQQHQAAQNLLEQLNTIETILVTDPKNRTCPEWKKAYQLILDTNNITTRQQMVSSLPEDHPLIPWVKNQYSSKNEDTL